LLKWPASCLSAIRPVRSFELPPRKTLHESLAPANAPDFTTNGWPFKSPRNFLQWLGIFSTPDLHLEFARRAMDPRQTVRMMTSLTNPDNDAGLKAWLEQAK